MAGIYLHIPFCRKRCLYCDFFSSVRPDRKERYVEALCREIGARAGELPGGAPETLYFGGGTPSQLSVADFHRLFEALERCFDLSRCSEITFEANPDDLTPAYLASLASLPFNRVSLGVQSFRDADLHFLNRRHTAGQAREAVAAARSAGIDNISIDLIYGLPGQTVAGWEANLDAAFELNIPHLSCYHLTYEPGTPLYGLRQAGTVREADEALSEALFHTLLRRTEAAGYEAYEISNFARSGAYSRHNSSYWRNEPYLGLGAAAHSYDGRVRRWNVSDLDRYLAGVEAGSGYFETETLTPSDRYNELVLVSLRTVWGLSLADVEAHFGAGKLQYLRRQAVPWLNRGLLRLTDGVLTIEPEGRLLSDAVISDLLFVE